MQHPWFLHDLPPGTLDVNTQLQSTDTERCAPANLKCRIMMQVASACGARLVFAVMCRYSSCRQTSQEILELVNACNAQRDNVKRRVTDIRSVGARAQQQGHHHRLPPAVRPVPGC